MTKVFYSPCILKTDQLDCNNRKNIMENGKK